MIVPGGLRRLGWAPSWGLAAAFWAAGCGPVRTAPEEESLAVPGTGITLDLVRVPGTAKILPFWVSKRLVTWGEFDRFYESPDEQKVDGITRPSSGKNYLGLSGYPSELMNPLLPVTALRIHSALAYCEWLSKKTGCTFRLPTETEWEEASRALRDRSPGLPGPESGPPGSGPLGKPAGPSPDRGELWEYCLEPDQPPAFGPVLRAGPLPNRPEARRQIIPAPWEEADPNRPFSTWWFRTGFLQGFRVVKVSSRSALESRQTYSGRIEVTGLRGAERTVRVGRSVGLFTRVTGEVCNRGDRGLTELILKVYYLDPQGKPHLEDVTSNLTRRATFNLCTPVLTTSAHPGPHALPLLPGQKRAFAVDLPLSLDAEEDVELEKFGASVLSLRFAQEDR